MKFSIDFLLHTYYIYRIQAIRAVFPKNGVVVPRGTYRKLSTYARKTEADIFNRANSRVCDDFYTDEARKKLLVILDIF